MAESTFRHLEILPLDEDNLILGTNPQANIKSKSCINLGFLAANSIGRLRNLTRLNSNDAKAVAEENSFLYISYILETLLNNILIINTISNLQNTEVTEHYRRRSINISSAKILPSFKYCQDLLYSNFKIWGGLYGTLQYYMNLREEYQEYYTPSQLVYFSSLHLAEYSSQVAYQEYLNNNSQDYKLTSNIFADLTNIINDPSEDGDKNIYGFAKRLLVQIPSLSTIYRDLRFYEEWLPKVYEWYINRVVTEQSIRLYENPVTNQERAFNTLIRVGQLILEKGLDKESFTNISSEFIRQTINPLFYDLLDEITIARKQSTYVEIDLVSQSIDEDLVKEFHDTIPILTNSNNYRTVSNIILSSFAPPGGYALIQVMLAATLLNRAYILVYERRNNQTRPQETIVYRRIIKLIGLAGILLIRTNKKHIQALGINILKIFNISLTNIQPNNFLDI